MSQRKAGVTFGTLAIATALTLTACGGSASTKSSSSPVASTGGSASTEGTGLSTPPATASGAAGGTLYYLTKRAVEHWDPQRVYIGRDISNSTRMFTRTLVQYPVTEDPKAALVLKPDLATNLGTASADKKTWKFTLKTGIKWQDGKPVTCADVKYGVSRTFATDIITGGPNYILQFLNIPVDPKGGSSYKGPYTKVGQAAYDKAVTCVGQTITFKFNKPWADFAYASTLPAFAPYRADLDKQDKSNYSTFSDGPYMEQGVWDKDKGGTFVRNPMYDAKTDGVRAALPDTITFTQGLTDEVIAQRLVADSGADKNAVSDRRIVPAYQAQAFGQAKARTVNPVSPFTDYLVPNFTRLTNLKVRQALAIAADKAGWLTATGGNTSGTVAKSMLAPTLVGYQPQDPFGQPDSGDPVKAKALLQSAGVKLPYPIKFTYSGGTPTTEKQAANMAAAWDKAGFKVTLDELTDTYYDVIQNPAKASTYDIAWGGWGADWPSGSTVIPPLFDDRINLSKDSNGQDYGLYKSKTVDAAIDAALNKTDVTEQGKAWADIDKTLQTDVAYIPLIVEKFVLTRGSNITNYINDPNTSQYPDLGSIGIKH